jgi:acyl dehydratase
MAHGALLLGYMSAASTAHVIHQEGLTDSPVSASCDKLRFLIPVKLGDVVTVTCMVANADRKRGRSTAKVEVANQKNELSSAGAERASVARGKERTLVKEAEEAIRPPGCDRALSGSPPK